MKLSIELPDDVWEQVKSRCWNLAAIDKDFKPAYLVTHISWNEGVKND
jgi:hypothetical protein